jgi:hypothetical protein
MFFVMRPSNRLIGWRTVLPYSEHVGLIGTQGGPIPRIFLVEQAAGYRSLTLVKPRSGNERLPNNDHVILSLTLRIWVVDNDDCSGPRFASMVRDLKSNSDQRAELTALRYRKLGSATGRL